MSNIVTTMFRSSVPYFQIGPYLPKLLQEKFGAVFLAHPVYCCNSKVLIWILKFKVLV